MELEFGLGSLDSQVLSPAALHVLGTPLHTSALICPCFVECASWHPCLGNHGSRAVAWQQGQSPALSAVLVHKAQPPPRWLGQNWAALAVLMPGGGSSTPGGHVTSSPTRSGSGRKADPGLSMTRCRLELLPPWGGPSWQPPFGRCPGCGLARRWGWHHSSDSSGLGKGAVGHRATLSWHRGLPFCHPIESEETDPFLYLKEGSSVM